jgi:hypothetical protein
MLKRLLAASLFLALSCLGAFAQTNSLTTNSSAVIAAGNTFQTVLSALGSPPASRRSLTIENNNSTDSCWIVIGGALGSATKGIAILLTPGGSYTRYYPYVPSDAIHATCTTTSDTLYVDVQ